MMHKHRLPMMLVLLTFSLLIGGCSKLVAPISKSEGHYVDRKDPNIGLVYFYRQFSLSYSGGGTIKSNGEIIGGFPHLGYTVHEAAPGTQSYSADLATLGQAVGKENNFVVNVEAGKRYYINVDFYLGRLGIDVKFVQVDEQEALPIISGMSYWAPNLK